MLWIAPCHTIYNNITVPGHNIHHVNNVFSKTKERAFATFDDLLEYELEPDHDSFSFLMESLAAHVKACVGSSATKTHPATVGQTPVGAVKKITTQLQNDVANEGQPQRNNGESGKRVEAQLSSSTDVVDFGLIVETADGILGMMEEREMQLDHNTLHQYIRLLAYTGKTERAKSILESAQCRVLLETLVRRKKQFFTSHLINSYFYLHF